jgi:hypothetical protein
MLKVDKENVLQAIDLLDVTVVLFEILEKFTPAVLPTIKQVVLSFVDV